MYIVMAESNKDDELNRIVRAVIGELNNHANNAKVEQTSSHSTSNRSTEEEIYKAFQIPRATSTSLTSSSHSYSQLPLSSQYSASTNYSTKTSSNSSRKRGKETMRAASGRFTKKSLGKEAPVSAPIIKDVCLLPTPTWDDVPRRKVKAQLVRAGLFVDAWPFYVHLGEVQLREELRHAFSEHLWQEEEEVG